MTCLGREEGKGKEDSLPLFNVVTFDPTNDEQEVALFSMFMVHLFSMASTGGSRVST